jgi:ferredoxin
MDQPEPIRNLIIPPDQAREVVKRAGQAFLLDCVCRVRQQACPPDLTNICLHFEGASAEDLAKGRPISTKEALAILEMAAEKRLVSQLFFKEARLQVTELCSCCDCCCTPIRRLVQENDYTRELRSGYVAVTDRALCVACELCLDSCFFEARRVEDQELVLVDERCFGCGRCVESCPEEAIRIEWQVGRGMPIPTG